MLEVYLFGVVSTLCAVLIAALLLCGRQILELAEGSMDEP